MRIRIYNHQFLNEDYSWIYCFLDQCKQMEDFGLMDNMEVMKITALGNETQIELMKEAAALYPKTEVYPIVVDTSDTDLYDYSGVNVIQNQHKFISEHPTIRRFWEDAQTEEFYGLYLHNKGSSVYPKYFKSKQHKNVSMFKNYFYWRKYLEWGVLEKWRPCIFALERNSYDIAGCNYNKFPFPHFSGNFWWANSTYIKTLDDVSDSAWWKSVKQHYHMDRLVCEMWPCHGTTKIFNLDSAPENLQFPNPGLYSESYTRKQYG